MQSVLTKQSVQPRRSFLFPDSEYPNHHETLKMSVISNYQHTDFSIMTKAPPTQILFYEAVASFIFIYGITCYKHLYQQSLQVVICLLLAICFSGSLSGANINPSITLSNCLRKQNKYNWRMFAFYILGQFIGALAGILMARGNNDLTIEPFIIQDTSLVNIIRVILSQAMGTFVMVFFILQITNPNTTFIENQMSGFLSIVIFVYLGIMLSPLASFFINFVMIIAVDIVASIFDGNHSGWSWAWAFLIGEILGAIGATLFYDMLFEPVIKKLRQVRRDSINFSQFTLQDQQDDEISEGQ